MSELEAREETVVENGVSDVRLRREPNTAGKFSFVSESDDGERSSGFEGDGESESEDGVGVLIVSGECNEVDAARRDENILVLNSARSGADEHVGNG